jgi:drug/metabolite transporter (DMT)-like permease
MPGVNVPPPLRMGTAEWCLLILLSVLWGGSFFFYKVLVAVLPPFTVVLARVGVAALILNAWLLARGDPMPRSWRLWVQFLVMGLLNNVIPFSLIAFGEVRIASGLASILNATTPIFTVIATHALTDNEKATALRLAGVVFGFVGTAVLVGPAATLGLGSGSLAGESACVLAAISYAFAGIYGRRFSKLVPLQVATAQITASTAVLLPVAVAVDRPWTLPLPGITVWLSILGIALLCTALAYIVYFRLLAAAGATNLLLVTFLLPISSLLLGWFVLGETVAASAFGGMALIGLGLAAIDGRPARLVWHLLPAALGRR